MGFYAPQKSIFQSLFAGIKNMFPKQTLPNTTVPTSVPTSVPQFYQVGANDNSMSDVANQLGVPLPDLVNANNGVKSLPPKGSYISKPYGPPNPNDALGYDPAMRGRSYGTYMASQTNAMQGAVNYSGNLNEAKAAINQQVQAGQMPGVVSFYTPIVNPTTGQPVSDQEMIANGYTYNNQNKQWELSNQTAPGTNGSGNDYTTNPALRLIRHGKNAHNKQNRYTETLKHAQVRWKKQKHGGGGKPAAPGTPQTTGTSSTVLGLHLGSG